MHYKDADFCNIFLSDVCVSKRPRHRRRLKCNADKRIRRDQRMFLV